MSEEKDAGKLEFWAILELFGHQRIAGYVRSVPLGGDVMLRVEVPRIKYQHHNYLNPENPPQEVTIEGFTKFYSPKSVYAMTPVSEEAARAAMQSFRVEPVQAFTPPALPGPRSRAQFDEDDMFESDEKRKEF